MSVFHSVMHIQKTTIQSYFTDNSIDTNTTTIDLNKDLYHRQFEDYLMYAYSNELYSYCPCMFNPS